ncbi:MAG: phage major tail tube protein [Hominilimicola sp.]
MSKIPSQVMDFSVYNGVNRIVGAGAEITLPTITSKTYTADLPAGELDLPSMRTENMELEIPFTVFDKEAGAMISLSKVTTVIIRGCLQASNTGTHDFDYSGVKVTAKGFAKEVALGTLKRSDKMDSKITMTLTYIKVEDGDGNIFMEIDKLNGTYIINGEDVRAGIDKYL